MFEIRKVTLEGDIDIAYYDEGPKNKPILLFIHGLASYKGVWLYNLTFLKNKYRCIAIDLPGNGDSSRGEYAYDLPFFNQTLSLFIDALKLKKITWVAHSMGGQIALYAALHKPSLVKKLVLCAPASFEYYTSHEANLFKSAIILGDFMNMDELHIANSIHSSFYQTGSVSQTIINDLHQFIQKNDRRLYRYMMERCMGMMLDNQLFPELKKVNQPTLVFFGENDMLIPNRFLHPVTTTMIAQQAIKEMPDASLFTFPQTGHFVQMEQYEKVNQYIDQWMEHVS